jgi:trans-aconitate 2-methyltransferase
LLYANAILQWIPDHPALFNRLFSMLVPGGILAVQMPLSWDQPSHLILREVASEHRVEINSPPTLDPDAYLNILSEASAVADVWVTTYHHVLTGDNPVFRWVSATGIKRFLDQIDPDGRRSYLDECAQRMAAAYPPCQNGETVFPFTRLFMLARAGS